MASATRSSQARRRRCRFARTRAARAGSRSSAVSCTAACSRMWQVLPPGAAQASSTRAPPRASSRRAANWAAPSCTAHSPSLQPGRRVTSSACASVMADPIHGCACAAMPAAANRSRYSARVVRAVLTRSTGDASWLQAATSASCCCGQSCAIAASSHAGRRVRASASASSRGSRVSRSRSQRRSTALTSPRCVPWPSASAACTVASSAACAGVPRSSSWVNPSTSSARTRASRRGSGRRSSSGSAASQRSQPRVPAYTRLLANARWRASASCGSVCASTSRRERPCSATSASARAASARGSSLMARCAGRAAR